MVMVVVSMGLLLHASQRYGTKTGKVKSSEAALPRFYQSSASIFCTLNSGEKARNSLLL
jgi:hypothetical protein